MNKVTKTMKKGFTLVELMVVMAIMSILLVAVMSMTTPVSRIYKRTNVSENVYSAADNITNYLQRTLEYADNVWVFDSTEAEAANLKDTALSFKNCYYKNVIKGTGTNATDCKFVSGKVHILKLSNSDGKITDTVYTYSDSSSDYIVAGSPIEVINPAYFSGDYANYNIRYALGASTLEAVTDPTGEKKMNDRTKEFYYNLKSEKDGETITDSVINQAITIVANKTSAYSTKPSGNPMEFEGPCVATVANLPFTNITARGNKPESRLFIPGTSITDNIHSQLEAGGLTATDEIKPYRQQYVRGSDTIKTSYVNLSNGKPISFTSGTNANDIYFVYAYADELVAS